MAEVKVPIFKGTYEDNSGVASSTLDKRIINGFRDIFDFIHKRPAFTTVTLNTAGGTTYGTKDIYGAFMTQNETSASLSNKIMIVAADSTTIYVYEGNLIDATGNGDIQLYIDTEDTYAKASAEAFLKSGGPKYIEGTNASNAACAFLNTNDVIYMYDYVLAAATTINPAEIPNAIIDHAFVNKRLLAIETFSDRVYYSAVGDPTDFSSGGGGGSFQAESQADQLRRIMANGGDLNLFGPNSIDQYYSTGDATTPFARYDGAEIKIGLAYADALVDIDATYYFLGSDSGIYALRGRDIKKISAPIDKYLRSINNFNETMANHIRIDGQDFVMFNFRDALDIDDPFTLDSTPPGVTFVYHIQLDAWYIWSDTSTIGAMTVVSSTDSSIFGMSVMADFGAQVLQHPRLDTGYSSNKEDMIVTSGNISLDTNNRKSSKRLTGRLKGAVGPTIKFREGPDSDTAWASSTSVAVTITDASGELMKIMRLGQYRVRQYQLHHTDDSAFSFGELTEEVTVLGS